MAEAQKLVELTRGGMLESWHAGHAVIADGSGAIREAWGDPEALIYPRSSCKMIQALPLAEAFPDLALERRALACASHEGAALHREGVSAWLSDLSLGAEALVCGPQPPRDRDEKFAMIRAHETPTRVHNNCSGKHAGFLQLAGHLDAGPDYCEPDHPVQRAVRAAFEDVTGDVTPGFGIDGCSAPNFACTVTGLARAMARFACASTRSGARDRAMTALTEAMVLRPDLVAGEGRACTELMRAMEGRAAIKTGAEGVFVAIVPEKRLGIAVKIADGATRAAECVIAALLAREGVLDPDHPLAKKRLAPDLANWDGRVVGEMHATL
ncbi:asparaginase [Histidinibacterium aquaticum]|uniref:Asparaginase n=1 Tax=Histidinibacterium aquaticum TaxID=2613962 RepID=A0A5J5GD62_9RHOB|nr:asparaginase [Histidinibacterium aquaticum]KAA9006115.1 asparaginase [Histidinibacterium aquaticum]